MAAYGDIGAARCAMGAECTHPDCEAAVPSVAPTPRTATPAERDEERMARILEALPPPTPARTPSAILDTSLAECVGILDRDALRPFLVALAIVGKVELLPDEDAVLERRWIDGIAPWWVRLAPAGTPSLEQRIVDALAEA